MKTLLVLNGQLPGDVQEPWVAHVSRWQFAHPIFRLDTPERIRGQIGRFR